MIFGQLSQPELWRMLVATVILVAGVTDDLRSRKYHNRLFLVSLVIGGVSALVLDGATGIPLALLGLVVGTAVLLPFVLLKMVGAGDMKLMAVFGLVAGYASVVPVLAYGMVWGALFGVVRIFVNGQGRMFATNLVSIVLLKERKGLELHRMPFTIAILMGWLSHLVTRGMQ